MSSVFIKFITDIIIPTANNVRIHTDCVTSQHTAVINSLYKQNTLQQYHATQFELCRNFALFSCSHSSILFFHILVLSRQKFSIFLEEKKNVLTQSERREERKNNKDNNHMASPRRWKRHTKADNKAHNEFAFFRSSRDEQANEFCFSSFVLFGFFSFLLIFSCFSVCALQSFTPFKLMTLIFSRRKKTTRLFSRQHQ